MIKGRDIMMMNRRTFSTALLAGAAASLISTRGMPANATPPTARNVVLVHGAWVDGSRWKPVNEILVRDGYHVSVVHEPLTSLQDDIAATKRILASIHGFRR
jgi:hypothetical protein